MDESIQKAILAELTTIKKLLAQNVLVGESKSAQIAKLNSLGFRQKEIAELLGTTSNTVNVTLNRLKKSSKQNKKPEPKD